MNISYFWVGLGGAVGAMARVGLMRFIPAIFLSMPLKIFCINVIGCFLIGAITEVFLAYGSVPLSVRHFLIQGFLGGFTTFSAFALEFGLLYQKGSHTLAIFYAIVSVVISIVCFFLGLKLVKLLV